jgi:DNA (cytosine-5)-methyltransferase 1
MPKPIWDKPNPKMNEEIRRQLLENRPVAIDLFSGVGGLSLGLELAGFFSAVHVEIEEEASRYAEFNFPLAVHLRDSNGDVRTISQDCLSKAVGGKQVALLAGGPPCQGFSRIGRQKVGDPHNDLVLEMARIILELQPLSFCIENVPGSLDRRYWQFGKAIEMLSESYEVGPPQTLRAEDFGVPQRRRRVFTLGIRADLGLQPPIVAATYSANPSMTLFESLIRTPNVGDAILDLPNCDDYAHLLDADEVAYELEPHSLYARSMRDPDGLQSLRGYAINWEDSVCTNLRRTQHGPKLLAAFSKLLPGESDPSSRIPRLDPDGLSVTIRAGTTSARGSWSAPRPCHPIHPRVLTTRECARLQSFPDWFRFHPVKWHGNRQVGNAVPPLLGLAVGNAIRETLGYARYQDMYGVAERHYSLIWDDIQAASASGNGKRRVSHKVENTGRKYRATDST